jgi:hypothetical protein
VKVSVNDGVGPTLLEERPTLLISSLQDTRLISIFFFLFRNKSMNIGLYDSRTKVFGKIILVDA